MITVLIADDSTTVRLQLQSLIASDPELAVAGTAANGKEAFDKFLKLRPDVVVLDPDMPVMDGLTALSAIRKREPEARVIMCVADAGDGDGDGTKMMPDALARGARDCIVVSGAGARGQAAEAGGQALIAAIKKGFDAKSRSTASDEPPGFPRPAGAQIVVMAASTGGTEAVRTVLSGLPADFRTPVLVVQHMPANMIPEFANRLERCCPLRVQIAEDDARVEPGQIRVARGDHHMECTRRGPFARLRLHRGPPEHGNRPAADPLFRSAAQIYGPYTLGVVLTGMGVDGLDGCRRIHEAGGMVLVQDGASSVVWGMPGAVADAGMADAVLDLSAVAPAIVARASAAYPLAARAAQDQTGCPR